MSKRCPTEDERIRQSKADRDALIARLEEVLLSQGSTIGEDERERMRRRIAELKRRNEDPKFSLNRGNELYTRNQPSKYGTVHGWGL